MEPTRLIFVPQARVQMRYQEWWHQLFIQKLTGPFDVVTLGSQEGLSYPSHESFSGLTDAVNLEMEQTRQFLDMNLTDDDVLLHMDLSYPGLFHQALFHRRPARCAVFCHATALNRFDYFQPVRTQKWRVERTHAQMYDKVLVATEYHKEKLGLKNVVSLGALPNPTPVMPEKKDVVRHIRFASTARPTPQKVDQTVEAELEKLTGDHIRRHQFLDWTHYFNFLNRTKFLVVTSKEETYGYQIVDAILQGATPIAPRAFSYPELLPARLLYDPDAKAEERAKQILSIAKREEKKGIPGVTLKNETKVEHFFDNLIKELKSL